MSQHQQPVLKSPRAVLLNPARRARCLITGIFASPLPRAAKAMLAVNVCLVAILVAEIMGDIDAAPKVDSIAVPLMAVPPTVSHKDLSSVVSASENLETAASKIVSRPLFAPGRRPPPTKGDSAPATAVVEQPVKLVGTIVSDHSRVALLEVAGKQIARVVGDSAGNSRIVEIVPGLIRLQSGEGQISDVRLTRGTRVEPTSQPPPVRHSLLQ